MRVSKQDNYNYWYDLGEFNIFKKNNNYKFVNVGGTIIEIDLDTALTILSLQGHTIQGAYQLLKNIGFDIKKDYVEEVANFIEKEKLTNLDEEKPKSRRFETKKVIENLVEIQQGAVILQDIAVTISGRCQMDCKYCFRKYFNLPDRLTTDKIKELIWDLRKLGCLTINLSGGEPALFHELTTELGKEAKIAGFENISVSTTGYGLTKEILLKWKDAGITYLNFALSTMDEELQNDMMRKKDGWQQAKTSAAIACEIGLQVRLNATMYKGTEKTVNELAQFGNKIGVYKTRYNPYVAQAEVEPNPPWVIKKIYQEVKELEKRGYNVYCPIEPEYELPKFMICSAGITKAVVEVDGSVGACQFLGVYPEPAGNILYKSIIDIWHNGNWKYYRADLENRKMSEPCVSCANRIFCISFCLAYAKALVGDAKVEGKVRCPWQ